MWLVLCKLPDGCLWKLLFNVGGAVVEFFKQLLNVIPK